MAVHVLNLFGWHPTPLNKLMGGGGRFRKAKDRRVVGNAARFQAIPPAVGRRRVGIEIVYPKGRRRHDPDAMYKSTFDALVKAKLLVDDSIKWVEITPPVLVHGEKAMTVITLEDVPPLPRPKRARKPKPAPED